MLLHPKIIKKPTIDDNGHLVMTVQIQVEINYNPVSDVVRLNEVVTEDGKNYYGGEFWKGTLSEIDDPDIQDILREEAELTG